MNLTARGRGACGTRETPERRDPLRSAQPSAGWGGVYIKQAEDPTWKDTTPDYKSGWAGSLVDRLNEASALSKSAEKLGKHTFAMESSLDGMADRVNSNSNATGYRFFRGDSGAWESQRVSTRKPAK